ncbi:MAG: SiaB family protein kinase [Sulfuriferula sp.]
MQLDQFNAFRDSAHQAGVIFFYTGYFSQSIISAMADSVKHKLALDETSGTTARKVFSTFVEMAQNVIHYSEDHLTDEDATDNEMRFGTVAVGRENEKYFIVCGNVVDKSKIPMLRDNLNSIRAMSLDEIKTAYRQQLRSESEVAGKGAGLGFLTLARDAAAPIEYFFVDMPEKNEANSFFYLKAII